MRKISLVLVGLALTAGCDSKRVDAPVATINGSATSLEDNRTLSAHLDNRISDLIGGLAGLNSKLKIVLRLTQGITKSSATSYTPIDAVLDILTEAKKGVAAKAGNVFQKEGYFEIGLYKEGDPCRNVKTFLRGDADIANKISTAKLTISNSCIKDGQEVEIASATWVEENFSMSLKLDEIQDLVANRSLTEINRGLSNNVGCQLTKDGAGQLNSAQCANLIVKIGDNVVASFDHVVYSGSGETSLKGDGKIVESSSPKATFDFVLPRDGEIKFNINRLSGT